MVSNTIKAVDLGSRRAVLAAMLTLGIFLLAINGCGLTINNTSNDSASVNSLPIPSEGSDRPNPVDASTLDRKILVGYQGWFRTPHDTNANVSDWRYWSMRGDPNGSTIRVDMYPDLTELDNHNSELVPGMSLSNGPARLFSSYNKALIDLHFKWMQTYNIDGVLIQRHVVDIAADRASGDTQLLNIVAAAQKYGRVFSIEYDLTDADQATEAKLLEDDWKYLVDVLGVTASPSYLMEDRKPVVSIWGLGFDDGRHLDDPIKATGLIEWMQSEAKTEVVGGVPAFWRTLDHDSVSDPRWTAVYRKLNVLQPWTVGRYTDEASADSWTTKNLQPDMSDLAQVDEQYMPVIFPGFSWHNTHPDYPLNEIPRNGGKFFWRQAANVQSVGAHMIKIAMFDEVNEGTAIFKVAATQSEVPQQGVWISLDADGEKVPSDWYLRLAFEITESFHAGKRLGTRVPENPGP